TVIISYVFTEQTLINEVQVVGNKLISDQDLLAVARQVRLGPRDDFRIEAAKRAMADLYKKKGHYLATVVVDQEQLEKNGILIFRIIEGPRVKVRAIEFKGNHAFNDEQLYGHIKTRPYIFIFRQGELDEDLLADDVAALDHFYKDQGYLDVRTDDEVQLSPDDTEAKVTFLVDEGRQFTLHSVRADRGSGEAGSVFSDTQLAAMIEIHPGDVYKADLLDKSEQAITDAYRLMGYIDVDVQRYELRSGTDPQVDLVLSIHEGHRYRVGEVIIKGNSITKEKVIRKETRVSPGRYFDGRQIDEAKRRLTNLRLFNDVKLTIQQPTEGEDSEFRDLLVEVKEQHTGSIGFGVGAGSDSGVFGEITLDQRNFDINDLPESLDEFLSGRAFRGGGQHFNMTLRPGNEIFDYNVSLTEPHLFETDYSGRIGALVHQRVFDRYDEFRYGGDLRLGRAFGDIWAVSLDIRADNVELSNIDDFAPTEIFRDAGPALLTQAEISLTRTTITTLKRPGSGSRLELSLGRAGAFGGDYDYNTASLDYTTLFTIHEDFLGRRSILKLNSRMSYIFDGRAPTFERFYLGGRTMRGFDFRTISPKGIRNDNGQPSDDSIG
ncbi:MAG TPA: POTRA domain-containing protein, partial [Phycisphaerales bacterium]|nr:POTRA domain-containing protein [Phycisphaerales bacterium]